MLWFLTLLAAAAALSITVRLRYSSRAEVLLVSSLLWNLIVLVPIHVLGCTDRLYATSLGWLSFAFSSAALAGSFLGAGGSFDHISRVRAAALGLLRLPRDAFAAAYAARSVALVGLVASVGLLAFAAWLTYLAPSDSWDGTWYHDMMVGNAIQYHGYRMAPLPMNLTQQANGYPRNCEMTSLWFVIFSDRTFIELPSVLSAVPLLMGTYLLTMRYAHDRVASMAWAAGLLLVPGAALELRTTYVDLQVAGYLVAALYLCTRDHFRVRDGYVAGASLVLLMGAKSMSLAWVPMLGVVAAAKLVVVQRRRLLPVAAAVCATIAAVAAMAAVTYLRNWIAFKNPLWPIGYTPSFLHTQWPSIPGGGREALQWNRSLQDVYDEMLAVPVPGHDFPDTRRGYGPGVPFVLVPLSAVAGIFLLLANARRVGLRVVGIPFGPDGDRALNLLLVSCILLGMGYLSPALWSARYNLHLVVGTMCLVSWLSGAGANRRLADGAASVMVFTGIMMLWWAKPGFKVTPSDLLRRAQLPAAVRATDAPLDWTIAPEVATARERELVPGTLALWTDDVPFPTVLWNDHFSNRVGHLPWGLPEQMLQEAKRRDALWVATGRGSPLASALAARPGEWEAVGLTSRGAPSIAYRRRR